MRPICCVRSALSLALNAFSPLIVDAVGGYIVQDFMDRVVRAAYRDENA